MNMSPSTLLADFILMPLMAFVVGLFMALMMRKIAARLQRRIGPPLFQPLYDILKLYGKQTQVSHGLVHEIGVMVAVGGYIAVEIFVPVPGLDGLATKGGLVTLTYLMMIPSLGLALSVSACANPNGSIGISRALTAMLAYDIPFMLVIFAAAWHYQSPNLIEVVQTQQAGGIETWGIMEMPLIALAGLFSMQAMLGKQPFEIYVAPAEIATGPMVEMGGKFLGSLFVMQTFQFYTAGVIYTTLFLGGGENWLTFLPKVFAVVAIPMSLAYLFPRYRTEDMVRLVWKWPTILALLGLSLMKF